MGDLVMGAIGSVLKINMNQTLKEKKKKKGMQILKFVKE